uniref:Uncharacterized protein n=1 Tax=Aplanochytrium stocchinoi TaxID=215587 RepID=A0A7S3UYZ2_9STRA
MCLMLTPHEPASTHLHSIPCAVENKPCQLLVYINDLAVSDGDGDSALMIVAIPKLPNKDEANGFQFGLVDASTNKMKSQRNEVARECKELLPWEAVRSNGFSSRSKGLSRALIVHKVGNYNISVAPSLTELQDMVDWDKFTKPKDFDKRFSTLSDKKLFPFECAYVVAQAVVNVENDGFGIVFRDPEFRYFPTSHEHASSRLKSYDAKCYLYNQGEMQAGYFPFRVEKNSFKASENRGKVTIRGVKTKNGLMAQSFVLSNSEFLDENMKKLSRECINSQDGSKLRIVYPEINSISYCPINSNAVNQNIQVNVK